MLEPSHNQELPAIPGKRYFSIGEASELCAVKPHVLRYWELEFPQIKPVKRRGNRRYYQRKDLEAIRTIRGLLYDRGFTVSGARQQLLFDANPKGASEVDDLVQEVVAELELLLSELRQAANQRQAI
ncbi:MAG: MerR family transcriptional regulator [Moraxellaceae bacterium]|nr:MAG: MerR family transcriptional regulator [Moraxellaceae bacterium]